MAGKYGLRRFEIYSLTWRDDEPFVVTAYGPDDAAERAREARAHLMADGKSARAALRSALLRLRELGWRDGIYCPKGGESFAVLEFGSTGVFTGFYSGEWPTGHVIVEDEVTTPKGILWKPLASLTDEEEDARRRAAQDTSDFTARLGRAFGDAPDHIAADELRRNWGMFCDCCRESTPAKGLVTCRAIEHDDIDEVNSHDR